MQKYFKLMVMLLEKIEVLSLLKLAYENKGLIILTDPDYAGEEIRKYLCKHFPNAKMLIFLVQVVQKMEILELKMLLLRILSLHLKKQDLAQIIQKMSLT